MVTALPSTLISPWSAVDAGQDVDERRLAGAVVADQAKRLAPPEVEHDAFQRMHAGIPFVQVAHRDDHVVHRFSPPS
nr:MULTISPECIES: hypothetical protein [unclassified Mesorhizobium]